MTVTNTQRRADYDGDGSTTEFEVTFQFYEISVYVDGELQTEGTDYVVSQEEPGLAGAVVFLAVNGATPANGSAVVILGDTARTQSTDYVDNDDFPASVLEAGLDRLTMIAQEQEKKFDGFVRAVTWHKEIDPLDFAAHPNTIIFVNAAGNVSLESAEQILGGIDINDAIAAAAAAEAAKTASEAARDAAAASASAAATSADLAASATDILAANPHFTGLPEFEAGLRVGKNGGGDSLLEFYDDTNNTWRSLWFDAVDADWRVEDATGSTRRLWHEGNAASQVEAEAGEDNEKGMTALRVAQAIAALAGEGAFPAGTITLFGNTAAPPGWTKLTDLNDYAIRIVSGTVGTSGAFAYSTVFAARTPTGTVGGTVLDVARIPSHTHSVTAAWQNLVVEAGAAAPRGSQNTGLTTGATGGGGSHDHGFTGTAMAFNVNTADFIRAEKN